jgi:hypothetical protein
MQKFSYFSFYLDNLHLHISIEQLLHLYQWYMPFIRLFKQGIENVFWFASDKYTLD